MSALLKYPAPPAMVDIKGFGQLPEAFVNRAGMRFILCKPGTFMAGLSETESELAGNYGNGKSIPFQVKVTLTKPYYLANVQVSSLFAADGTVYDYPTGYHSLYPHTQPWYYAMDGLLRMSLMDGRVYRLPSQFEYEYASRAGTMTTWHWGDDPTNAWMYIPNGPVPGGGLPESDRPRQVGHLLPNDWIFYDLLGNTWQWTCTPFLPLSVRYKDVKEIVDPPVPPIAPGQRIFVKGGFDYRYGYGACGSFGTNAGGAQFGNNRNCSRIGGYRAAMDASQVVPASRDEAFAEKIRKLRIANFIAGGDYCVLQPDDPWFGVEYYGKALQLDPQSQAARDGLRRLRDDLLPSYLQTAKPPPSAERIEELRKTIEKLLNDNQ